MSKILITGGLGYFGNQVVKELLSQGYTVTVLDNDYYKLGLSIPEVELINDDVENITKYDVTKYDAVVALAAIVGDEACQVNPNETKRINLKAIEKLVQKKPKRLVFSSTCSVYGKGYGLMNEGSLTNPLSLYAEVKNKAEKAVLGGSGCNIVIRCPTFFGYSLRPRFDLVVNNFIARAYFDNFLIVNGDGKQIRPFCHIKDAAKGIVSLLKAPENIVKDQIFNLGGVNYSIAEVAEKVAYAFPGTKIKHREGNDERDYLVDFAKIKALIGFEPQIVLEDAINEFIEVFQKDLIKDYKDPKYSNYERLRDDTYIQTRVS